MKATERKLWEPLPALQDRIQAGKNQRLQTPREAHAGTPFLNKNRVDPVDLIIASNEGRLPDLVPIRHARMLQSPFAFYRGTAIIMAEDLAHMPHSDIYVQSCGDCHLMNFGGYATPERKQVFDINDFDETLPAPFEWDLKRLVASICLAGRYRGFSDAVTRKAVISAVDMYARKMWKYSGMHQMEIWYSTLDKKAVEKEFKDEEEFMIRFKIASAKARRRTHEHVFPRLSEVKNGERKIIDDPPLIYHMPNTEQLLQKTEEFFDHYYSNMSPDKKMLLNRFRLVDAVIKVVGVGSVGTRCFIALFVAEDDDALILQFKEAKSSVLENHLQKTVYENHGARIVNGQKLMQTVSDIFLGWTKDKEGHDFYVRQLRDMKAAANIENFTPGILVNYCKLCGWSLAKSHAKSGMSPEIAGYIGKSEIFAEAMADFAIAYADQAERDYQAMRKAADKKRIEVYAGAL